MSEDKKRKKVFTVPEKVAITIIIILVIIILFLIFYQDVREYIVTFIEWYENKSF